MQTDTVGNHNYDSSNKFLYSKLDIDECASIATNPCEHNCLNSEGGFSCSCMTGYSQNGFFCDGELILTLVLRK